MPSKSPLNITEDALAAVLDAEAALAGYTIFKGQAATELELPSIIVSCESAAYPGEISQGLGNYVCKVNIGIFNSIDDDTIATHREASQDVMGLMNDLATIKASFVTIGDATCYDVTQTSLDEGRGERAFMTTLAFDVLICLSNT
jgi:hypothetical protein